MKYQNAAKGIKKIFTAEILSLLMAVCIIAAIVMGVAVFAPYIVTDAETLTNIINDNPDVASTIAVSGVAIALLLLAVIIFDVVSFILNLVGIIQASRDEGNFKKALVALIVTIVISVCICAVPVIPGILNSTLLSVLTIVMKIARWFVTFSVILGIINISDRLNRGDISAKGSRLLVITMIIYMLIVISYLLVAVFSGMFATIVAGILMIISSVLSIIQYILYLSYLSKAKKMFAEI